jgi:hypothetical protein
VPRAADGGLSLALPRSDKHKSAKNKIRRSLAGVPVSIVAPHSRGMPLTISLAFDRDENLLYTWPFAVEIRDGTSSKIYSPYDVNDLRMARPFGSDSQGVKA